jgi:hypothetical protein
MRLDDHFDGFIGLVKNTTPNLLLSRFGFSFGVRLSAPSHKVPVPTMTLHKTPVAVSQPGR